MKDGTKRKEVWISDFAIEVFQVLADKKGWSLKQTMEDTLEKYAAKRVPPKEDAKMYIRGRK